MVLSNSENLKKGRMENLKVKWLVILQGTLLALHHGIYSTKREMADEIELLSEAQAFLH